MLMCWKRKQSLAQARFEHCRYLKTYGEYAMDGLHYLRILNADDVQQRQELLDELDLILETILDVSVSYGTECEIEEAQQYLNGTLSL